MDIEVTYLDAEGVERVQTIRCIWDVFDRVIAQGYVLVPYPDRFDIVPIHRVLGMRVYKELPQ